MVAQPLDIQLINSLDLIDHCVADLFGTASVNGLTEPPVTTIAIDLEGINLSRDGQVCIVQLKSNTSSTVWLLDITTLGQTAFDHEDSEGRSIRSLLESTTIKKVII